MSQILTSKRRTDEKTREVHLNLPQLLYWLVQATLTIIIWGRATGKTDGPSAIFTAECMSNMPRCVIRIASYTYEGLMKNILPGIIKGWEKNYGYVEGMHFWVGKPPPESLNIPKPYRKPRGDSKHMIYWANGSVAVLSSMDRTINNGTEYEAILIEEARLCDEAKVKELIMAKRGNREYFGDSQYYGAVLMVTDRPKSQEQRWILNYEKEHTAEIIGSILEAWKRISKLEEKEQDQIDKKHFAAAKKTRLRINKFVKSMNKSRKAAVMFSEASTLDNIHAIGVKTIESFIKLLGEWDYNLSVLGIDNNKVVDGFYSLLSKRHFYGKTNYELWEKLGYDKPGTKRTCVVDLDCDLDMPLRISFDVNNVINNAVTGQLKNDKLYTLNHQFVKAPQFIEEMCDVWCDYYEPHHSKRVTFYYDHTLKGSDGQGKTEDYIVIIGKLQAKGWIVTPRYIGQSPDHDSLYGEWKRVFSGEPGYIKVRFNEVNCDYLRKSMDNTDIKYYDEKIKKNKGSERKDYKRQTYLIPPELATHAGEAMDSLMLGVQEEYSNPARFSSGEPFIG